MGAKLDKSGGQQVTKSTDCKQDEETRNRALKEAIMGLKMYHPNLFAFDSVHEDYQGNIHITMPQGKSLNHSGVINSFEDMIFGFIGVTYAVKVLHRFGLVHGNIKPSSMIWIQDTLKLMEFDQMVPQQTFNKNKFAHFQDDVAGLLESMAEIVWFALKEESKTPFDHHHHHLEHHLFGDLLALLTLQNKNKSVSLEQILDCLFRFAAAPSAKHPEEDYKFVKPEIDARLDLAIRDFNNLPLAKRTSREFDARLPLYFEEGLE